MTRLISNSTRSSWAASTDGGTGEPGLAGELSIGVLAALVTGLPGRAGPRSPEEASVDRAAGPPRSPVSYTFLCGRSCDGQVRHGVVQAGLDGETRVHT